MEDGLYSKGLYIKAIRELNMDFIIITKESDHEALFQQIRMYSEFNEIHTFTTKENEEFIHEFRFKNQVLLNGSSDQKVNFLEYWKYELKTHKKKHWVLVTSIKITEDTVMDLMRGGRARWCIENQTFNTLKNQGYHFEHNFGHGYRNLSTNFALLMLLAFAIDQLQEHCCRIFKKALEKNHSRIVFWETMRSRFLTFLFQSWEDFFHSLAFKKVMIYDSS